MCECVSLIYLCCEINVTALNMNCVRATGGTMSVVLDLSYILSIWISAAVAIIYTLLGGLYSVAYTDIIQLGLIFISMVSSLYCVGLLRSRKH